MGLTDSTPTTASRQPSSTSSTFPGRPTDSAIDAGSLHAAFHGPADVRRGTSDGCGDALAASARGALERLAASFARTAPVVAAAPDRRQRDDLQRHGSDRSATRDELVVPDRCNMPFR
jgi:hypothetical protein